nr:hypothetical protein [uncultured bacterium]
MRDSVVVLREDASGDPRLVAYLVPRAPGSLSLPGVRAFVRGRLPAPMVPGAWVVLEALPLTPNGKTDRAALPAPESTRPAEAPEHVAPRTPTEQALAGIWAEVLGADPPGIADDFLELGGHSLLAMRVVARVRESLGVELPLAAVLEARTVAALAERVDATGRPADVPPAPKHRADLEPAPLSFSQQRLWLLDRLDPGSPVYNVPAVVRLSGALDRGALHRALEEIVRRHDALRTTVGMRDGEPVQVVAPAGPVPLPLDDLTAAGDGGRSAGLAEVEREEARRPFDLARGPLFRARLVRVAEDDHVLLLTMHHVVADGWSLEVLFRELAALYAALAAGRPSPLPDLPVRFADFAFAQREHIRGQALASLLDYWVPRLRGAPPAGAPGGPAPPGAPQPRRRDAPLRRPGRDRLARHCAGAGGGCDAVHGAARRLQALPGAARGRVGRDGGIADRRSGAAGSGGRRRLLRRHAGAADEPRWGPVVPGRAAARAGGDAGGVRARRASLRAAGGGARRRAGRQPQPRLPDVVRRARPAAGA